MRYMDDKRAKEDKVFDHEADEDAHRPQPENRATVGYRPDVWETWE